MQQSADNLESEEAFLEAEEAEAQPAEAAFIVEDAQAGQRLDVFLVAAMGDTTRAEAQRLIESPEGARVNGRHEKANYRVRVGDAITVKRPLPQPTQLQAEAIPLTIVYEDSDLLVIDKPRGMVVHPAPGATHGTLVNAVLAHADDLSGIGGELRPGIVHRLDKDTSGLILIAKNEEINEALSEQFRTRTVEKHYIALVHGAIRENTGKIDRPIARERHNRLRMTVSQDGRSALTLWKVRQRFEKFTLLDIEIKTGRTHQIRVHLASINNPVVGDPTYNEGRDNTVADPDIRKAIKGLNRQLLHAQQLSFTHPKTSERLTFTADLPSELNQFLDKL